jgi:cytochrome c oxidase cbb3-type subunit 2
MKAVNLHRKLEENTGLLIFGILFVSAIGGLVQVLPSIFQKSLSTPGEHTRPYPTVELVGRDIYIREACSVCHSQQVRPILAEVRRYGPYSRAGESVYDRPFLWGSKRTGPDLHRIGGRYSDAWHKLHLQNPRAVVKNSIMAAYPWLAERAAKADGVIQRRMRVRRRLGRR